MPPSHSISDGPSSPISSPRTTLKSIRSPSSQTLHKSLTKSKNTIETRHELLTLAAAELEAMRAPTRNSNQQRAPPQKQDSNGSLSSSNSSSSSITSTASSTHQEIERSFPPACLHLLHTLSGNPHCHDCRASSASWASVSYGITLCLQCSGKHRGLGVQCSFIKSLTLDSWKRQEILCMLEGGNEQLASFLDRHGLGGDTGDAASGGSHRHHHLGLLDRYKTKAASFYRQHLRSHAKQVAEGGLYEGREASRKSKKHKSKQSSEGDVSPGKTTKRKKSRELPRAQQILQTVTEKELVELACGVVGA